MELKLSRRQKQKMFYHKHLTRFSMRKSHSGLTSVAIATSLLILNGGVAGASELSESSVEIGELVTGTATEPERASASVPSGELLTEFNTTEGVSRDSVVSTTESLKKDELTQLLLDIQKALEMNDLDKERRALLTQLSVQAQEVLGQPSLTQMVIDETVASLKASLFISNPEGEATHSLSVRGETSLTRNLTLKSETVIEDDELASTPKELRRLTTNDLNSGGLYITDDLLVNAFLPHNSIYELNGQPKYSGTEDLAVNDVLTYKNTHNEVVTFKMLEREIGGKHRALTLNGEGFVHRHGLQGNYTTYEVSVGERDSYLVSFGHMEPGDTIKVRKTDVLYGLNLEQATVYDEGDWYAISGGVSWALALKNRSHITYAFTGGRGGTITNNNGTLPNLKPGTQFMAKVIWEDGNPLGHNLVLELYRDGIPFYDGGFKGVDSSETTTSWEFLPKYQNDDMSKSAYVYAARLREVPAGYSVTYDDSKNTITLKRELITITPILVRDRERLTETEKATLKQAFLTQNPAYQLTEEMIAVANTGETVIRTGGQIFTFTPNQTVIERAPHEQPTIQAIDSDDLVITGQGDNGAVVRVTIPAVNGQQAYTKEVIVTDGTWKISLNQSLPYGTTITAEQDSMLRKRSSLAQQVVRATLAETRFNKPVLTPVDNIEAITLEEFERAAQAIKEANGYFADFPASIEVKADLTATVTFIGDGSEVELLKMDLFVQKLKGKGYGRTLKEKTELVPEDNQIIESNKPLTRFKLLAPQSLAGLSLNEDGHLVGQAQLEDWKPSEIFRDVTVVVRLTHDDEANPVDVPVLLTILRDSGSMSSSETSTEVPLVISAHPVSLTEGQDLNQLPTSDRQLVGSDTPGVEFALVNGFPDGVNGLSLTADGLLTGVPSVSNWGADEAERSFTLTIAGDKDGKTIFVSSVVTIKRPTEVIDSDSSNLVVEGKTVVVVEERDLALTPVPQRLVVNTNDSNAKISLVGSFPKGLSGVTLASDGLLAGRPSLIDWMDGEIERALVLKVKVSAGGDEVIVPATLVIKRSTEVQDKTVKNDEQVLNGQKENQEKTLPQTGDDRNIFAAIGLASLIAATGMFFVRKRQTNEMIS